MPQIVPVSDFRADIKSVSKYTDAGEVVVLTQNGRPRWAMIDFAEWNAASQARERAFARAILETEAREARGESISMSSEEFERRMQEHLGRLAERAGRA